MKINTTADLREVLLRAIEQVETGDMESKKARDLALLADKVIAVSMLELKYSEVVSRLDRQDQGITPGPLMLTNGKVANGHTGYAAKEYLARTEALASIDRFGSWLRPSGLIDFKYPPARHHKIMIDALERLERGEFGDS